MPKFYVSCYADENTVSALQQGLDKAIAIVTHHTDTIEFFTRI
jgi:hypothetical protein